MSRLLAISDLHLSYEKNRAALSELRHFPGDWLIVAGDVSESPEQFAWALDELVERFGRVIWVPGNHDLWTIKADGPRGEAKYRLFVDLCRERNVLTPEDPYVRWEGEGPGCTIAPLFLLYDYSFRPKHVRLHQAVDWSAERGVVCADESFLHPDPWPSREAWCRHRLEKTIPRLEAAEGPLILVNHWPLREDLLRLRPIPTFSIWCGTRETEQWHRRFPVHTVVYGHLHVRERSRRHGTLFEEVSLGYPRDWRQERGVAFYLREILPGSTDPPIGFLNPKKF